MPDLDAAGVARLEQRFRALLPHLNREQTIALLEALGPLELNRLETPETGLVMVTALDAFSARFYLGEVLVSVAEVEYDGVRGHATVMGEDDGKAVLAATVSALVRHPDGSSRLDPFRERLDRFETVLKEAQSREANLIAATRVNFDRMAPETM